MEITVKRNPPYCIVEIENNHTSMNIGMFDVQESIDLAKDLILAAEELLPPEKSVMETFLATIRENL